MKLGISTKAILRHGVDVGGLVDICQTAETVGFDSFWFGHHILIPPMAGSDYPYGDMGHEPTGEIPRLDPFTLFGFLGAHTTRLRFATGVFVLPMVNPFVTARMVTTADVLTEGRIIFGIGVGWNANEFALIGEDFHNRGARTDEILDVLRSLWTDESTSYQGTHLSFGPVAFEPKPVQRPHPPIVYGGSTPVALRRAALLDGCYLPAHPPAEVADLLARLHEHRAEAGRDGEPFEITLAAEPGLTTDRLVQLEELGVDRVLFDLNVDPLADNRDELPPSQFCSNLERAADALLVGVS